MNWSNIWRNYILNFNWNLLSPSPFFFKSCVIIKKHQFHLKNLFPFKLHFVLLLDRASDNNSNRCAPPACMGTASHPAKSSAYLYVLATPHHTQHPLPMHERSIEVKNNPSTMNLSRFITTIPNNYLDYL